jgi:regulator of RNase E activity RraB
MNKAKVSLNIHRTIKAEDVDEATEELVKKLEGEGWGVEVDSVDAEDDDDDADADDADDEGTPEVSNT